ncbi:odorant receptor 49a-like [Ctenocephalides felis]|uniref:odorant receptor 49a-like n=1 Tax=Ctenocephalides felis TaxID=7515 RepID=UPI000E6E27E3|nr:odorant receptor 49a-like [Ctenocephalides felis]
MRTFQLDLNISYILQSGLLPQAAFSSSWMNAEMPVKKNIIIFMERSKRPLKIYAGKMLELSLQTFSTIINSSYRYYAVLQHMQSTKNI